ncbi:MAG: glutathione S-transferase family protein [Candidatus Binatia bacterium]
MQLYHSFRSRSTRPRWLLEEIGVPYELVRLDRDKGAHKTPEYLKIHPHGVVPALVDGDVTVFESAAICLYLADKFPAAQLAPPPGSAARALYYQWIVYTMATLEPPVLQVFSHTLRLPEAQRSPRAADEGRRTFTEVARVLAASLDGKPYMLGERFSAADVMIGSTLGWCRRIGLLADQPVLDAYVTRLSARPAFQRAQAD